MSFFKKGKKVSRKSSSPSVAPSSPVPSSPQVDVSAPNVGGGGWSKSTNRPDDALLQMLKMQCDKEIAGVAPERSFIQVENLEAVEEAGNVSEVVDEEGLIFTGEIVNGIPMIKGGELSKLVERLTYPDYHDPKYMNAFVLTFKSFATPEELLDLLIKRFVTEAPPTASAAEAEDYNTNVRKKIRLRIFNVLRHWITTSVYDFIEDEKLKNTLESFIANVMKPEMEAASVQLYKTLMKSIADPDNKQEQKEVMFGKEPPVPHLPNAAKMSGLPTKVLGFHPEELARQLTLIEFDLYASIKPSECVSQNWMHKTKKQKLAPNILKMISRFNDVSTWVASEIVRQPEVSVRTQLLKHFIEMADYCKQLHNVNACMEIISGLQSSSVFRLKQTWGGLDKTHQKMFDDLHGIMNRELNYRDLRAFLHSIDPPTIPYLGMYLTDLTFVEDGNKDFLPENNLINFQKRQRLSEIISEIQIYQNKPYCLEPVVFIQDYLLGVETFPEEACYKMSLKREGRDGTTGDGNLMVDEPYGEMEVIPGNKFAEPDRDSNIQFESKHTDDASFVPIVAATLPKLVERLTYHKCQVDIHYIWTFLTAYKRFTTAEEFLELLKMRYNMPKPKMPSKQQMEKFKSVQMIPVHVRIVNVLKFWVQNFFEDFEEEPKLQEQVKELVDLMAEGNKMLAVAGDGVKKIIEKKVSEKEESAPLEYVGSHPSPDNIGSSLLEMNPDEIVAALTLIELRLLQRIKGREFFIGDFSDENIAQKAPNLNLFRQHYENVRRWAGTEIANQPDVADRAKVIAMLIAVLAKLLKYRNFSSSMAILNTLKASTLDIDSTLTWVSDTVAQKYASIKKLSANQIKALEKSDGNVHPTIPYIDNYIQRLQSLEHSLMGLSGGLVNFSKYARLYDTYKSIETYSGQTFNFEGLNVDEAHQYLVTLTILSDEKIAELTGGFERVVNPERRQSIDLNPFNRSNSIDVDIGLGVGDKEEFIRTKLRNEILNILKDDESTLTSLVTEAKDSLYKDLAQQMSSVVDEMRDHIRLAQIHTGRYEDLEAIGKRLLERIFPESDIEFVSVPDDAGFVYGWPDTPQGFRVDHEGGEQIMVALTSHTSKADISVTARLLDHLIQDNEAIGKMVVTGGIDEDARAVADNLDISVKNISFGVYSSELA